MREKIFSNSYMTLFSDGEIGLSDGVGYLDTLNKEEVFELGKAIMSLERSDNSGYTKCRTCGCPINKGEAELFGVCDDCYDKHFA